VAHGNDEITRAGAPALGKLNTLSPGFRVVDVEDGRLSTFVVHVR